MLRLATVGICLSIAEHPFVRDDVPYETFLVTPTRHASVDRNSFVKEKLSVVRDGILDQTSLVTPTEHASLLKGKSSMKRTCTCDESLGAKTCDECDESMGKSKLERNGGNLSRLEESRRHRYQSLIQTGATEQLEKDGRREETSLKLSANKTESKINTGLLSSRHLSSMISAVIPFPVTLTVGLLGRPVWEGGLRWGH